MHFQKLSISALVCVLLSACSIDSPLARAEANCNKFPTPDARAICMQKNREDAAAYSDYREKERLRADNDAKAPEAEAKPKNSLCFKRATGETVCPN
jgi:hypothetical protein